jgi:starch synthase
MPARKIVLIASEAVPFAKTGGLADVAGALPLALGRLGHDVLLVLPRYRAAERATAEAMPLDRFPIRLGGTTLEARFVGQRLGPGARAVLVDCPVLYERDHLYGVGNDDYPDNAVRFAFLVRAALEFLARDGFRADIVHAHDWQAGLAPVYLRTRYAAHPVLGGAASVFTIHNLAYQGLFPPDVLPRIDLGWDLLTPEQLEYWGKVSLLKGGINFCDVITTVSRRYAREIQTPEFGFGFDGILRRRARDLVGILNGIDTNAWDPASDPFLPAPYDPSNLDGKRAAKAALLAAFDMPRTEEALAWPVVAMISRLVDQKGFDLLAQVADVLLRLDATYVLLGSGEPRYQELWTRLATEYPRRVGARIGFDEPLAHLIEGGADIFLMPSRFEPCGLNQMYSLRYGTIPVVHATGGLDDTVEEWNPDRRSGTGFKFRTYTASALLRALRCALRTYARSDEWHALQRQAMRQDLSWDRSAQEYGTIYERAIRSAATTAGRAPGDAQSR